MFIEVRRHLKKIEIIILSLTNIAREPSNALNNKEKEFKKEFKPVKINIGLILCFFLFWSNVLIVNIKQLVYADELEPPKYTPGIHSSILVLLQIYYIFNPLWYVTLSHDVKREVKRLFKWEIG